MRWEGRAESGNVEDRRGMGRGGMRMGLPVGGGIGGVVLLLLVSALTGQNPLDLIGGSTDQGSYSEPDPNAPAATDPQSRFMRVVLKDTEDTWTSVFRSSGQQYEAPTLVLFSDATDTACGLGQSAMGPFYCPPDRKVYLDTSFFEELDQRFGAPGDFAQAYVIAHEIGHHVQNLLGLSERVQSARQRVSREEGNALSVRLELQADCYAGVWGHYAAQRDLLEPGDADEGMRAAAAIGDDRLQRQGQGRVVPESFTHGSSEQRMSWLRRGLESGQIDSCDTFRE
ncbi:MAG TPA: neutral zinc metallopeptidase [Vicinamibacterales bacterium]|nr:neutral zinc metallopeptidase [Vicinamibacterales bacterium]